MAKGILLELSMMRLSRKVIILCGISALLVLLIGGMLLYRAINIGIASSIEHKSAKTTSATIVDCPTRSAPAGFSETQIAYTFCYTLDDLNQVEPDLRSEYEGAERHRDEILGPRCRVSGSTEAARLRPGDKIRVRYLLSNNYAIEIVAIEAFGVELPGEDVRFANLRKSFH
jgi:hypothetical protein